MRFIFNINDICKVKLTNYGAILYNDFRTKNLDENQRIYYFNNNAVNKGDVIEGSLDYLIKALQLGSDAHGFSAIEEGVNGEVEVFEEGSYYL